ncbi:MAG: TIM barrel protein [archaeon]
MAIRLGPAGIPLACKGKTTHEGVRCVSALGLDALEIEFVRSIYLDSAAAMVVGRVARELDVALSCHAPYFINLASRDDDVVVKSRKYISDTLRIADACGATVAVVHAGFYMGRGAHETFEMIKKAVSDFDSRALLGIETMGRQKQFGTLDEVERMTIECENVVPVVDFAHVHARLNGGLRTKDDFRAILDRFERIGVRPIHCHMTGIKYDNGNEKHHLALSSYEPDFRLLAEVLRENEYDVTLISESPVLEEDAILFKGWVGGNQKK